MFALWILENIPKMVIHGVVLAGIVSLFIGKLIPSIALMQKEGLKLLGILLLAGGLFLEGSVYTAAYIEPQLEQARAEVTAINKQAKVITKEVEIRYVERTKVIKEKGDEVIKYITINNDRDCSIHNSTVELWNSAAENRLPDPTRRSDESPSGIALSEADKVIIDNYNQYNLVAEQLRSLQDWVREQQINNMNGGVPQQPKK